VVSAKRSQQLNVGGESKIFRERTYNSEYFVIQGKLLPTAD